MQNLEAKLTKLAQSIEGKVIHASVGVNRTQIKGIVSGFPVSLEIGSIAQPFSLNYFLETNTFKSNQLKYIPFKIIILPRYIRGWLSFFSRILFFESKGQKTGQPELDSILLFQFDRLSSANDFLHYPEIAQKILSLEKVSHFNEMIIKSDTGLYLSQPGSINTIDLDACQQIFNIMADLGQVLFTRFS